MSDYTPGERQADAEIPSLSPSAEVELDRTYDNWSDRSAGMVCATCMWWVIKDSNTQLSAPKLGRCRKRAPIVGEGWPATFGNDWCGDHKLDEEQA